MKNTRLKWHIKRYPILDMSEGAGADPVSRQSACRRRSHKFGGRPPLLSTNPALTFAARQRHRPLASTKLYCLVTEAHVCGQLARSCYLAVTRQDSNRGPFRSYLLATVAPPSHTKNDTLSWTRGCGRWGAARYGAVLAVRQKCPLRFATTHERTAVK